MDTWYAASRLARKKVQIAGFNCVFCCRPVVLESEGEACSACRAVAHRTCVEGSGKMCPCCGIAWRDLRRSVVFAHRCPSCGRENTRPEREACPACHALLAFDSAAELRQERHRVHSRGVLLASAGVTLIVSGAALVAGCFLLGLYSFGTSLLAIPAGLLAVTRGATLVVRSRAAFAFR